MAIMPSKLRPDYDEVFPNLYVGSMPKPGIRYKDKFDLLVLCAAEYQPTHDYLPLAPAIYQCPMLDSTSPREAATSYYRATLCARKVAEALSEGAKVLVTCIQGRNRASLVAALAIQLMTGRPGWYAMAMVRANRRPFGKSDVEVLSNPYFAAKLRLSRPA